MQLKGKLQQERNCHCLDSRKFMTLLVCTCQGVRLVILCSSPKAWIVKIPTRTLAQSTQPEFKNYESGSVLNSNQDSGLI